MKVDKILFVYRTKRRNIFRQWQEGKGPDTLLYSANHLKNLGYEISFFDYPYSTLNILHPIFYPLEHGIIKSTRMGFKIDQALALLPIMRNYDLIIATGDSAGLAILALKKFKLLKKPVIHITSGLAGALRNKEDTWVFNFYKNIFSYADLLVAYSKVEIDFFENYIGLAKAKVKYVPLGVDYNFFSQKSNSRRNIICSIGSDSCRDYKTFFEAVNKMAIQAEIVCYPDNIKDLQIPRNVKVHTNISIQEVRKIYQRATISVIPSYEKYRSTGQIVFLESAAAQVPVLATKIMGLTTAFKLINNVHILYSKPQDSQDLKEKISYLVKNKKKSEAIAINGSKLVKNHYTTLHFAQNIAKLIRSL